MTGLKPKLGDYESFEMSRCTECGSNQGGFVYQVPYTWIEQWPEGEEMPVDAIGKPFWTVYGRTKDGLAEAIKDFDSAEKAQQYFVYCKQVIVT